jgi:two-component SAPR family response regulator
MYKTMTFRNKLFLCTLIFCFPFFLPSIQAKEIAESSFLIATMHPTDLGNSHFWNFIQSNEYTGIEVYLSERNGSVVIDGTSQPVDIFLENLIMLTDIDSSKVIPVFIHFKGNMILLDSVIGQSKIAQNIFFLPRGEAWPALDYLIQSNRRILLFVSAAVENQGRMLHPTGEYIFSISAAPGSSAPSGRTNQELFMIDKFDSLPVSQAAGSNIRNLVPDYINFLLENWTKFGKRPNFIFVNDNIYNFDFILTQLNSFTWITGTVRGAGKTMEKVYWRNPDVAVTGGRFSFPYRGGQELTLTPFVPGFKMTPEHIIVTGEMEVPESYHILASPLRLSDNLTGSFRFNDTIRNALFPGRIFSGENYSFSQDIERSTVLRLPENASINMGSPELYGLRNSSFTVSCFVKFSEVLEFGDNAVLGNYESEYRRGLHLILRSGHPYFGLWANDYISDEKLEANVWYHLVWRYIIETGEQAIYLNGRNIGSSEGHLPFSGTGDIFLGSALSQGASLRGYIDDLHFWSRPLGVEEITRLALNELVEIEREEDTVSSITGKYGKTAGLAIALLLLAFIGFYFLRKRKAVNEMIPLHLPDKDEANQLALFGGFRAVDRNGKDISTIFTPKVRELFLFILLSTLKNGTGALVAETDEKLWCGLPAKKITNNRAVTLNKLRKILQNIDGVEIITSGGYLQARLNEPFFCDYVEAYKLCQVPGGMDKKQLNLFFHLVKKGRFLKGADWHWLDEIRGYTGNQIIDNLLKLADIEKEACNYPKVEALARRILEYDDLNEEATWLQVWTLLQENNIHQAKFQFNSFCTKYKENLGEPYPMDFEQFNQNFSNLL